MSSIAPTTWDRWIELLEDILHDADVGQAHEFAIHIDSAILVAHSEQGTVRNRPHHDHLPNEKSKS